MRVTVVVSSLEAGGTERFSTLLAGGLADLRHDITLVTLTGRGRDFYTLADGVERVALEGDRSPGSLVDKLRRDASSLRALRRALRHSDPDVVVALGWSTNVITLVATFGRRVPVVISERSDPRGNPIPTGWRIGRRVTYPFAKRLVVQTETVRTVMRRWLPPSRIRVIPNPVLPRAAELQWHPTSAPTVVAMGRMSDEKGFDTLIAAFAIVCREVSGAALQLIGDGPLRGELEQQARSAGVGDAVAFTGKLSDPHPVIAEASCYVLPSRLEGFPNALLEAMAIGVPAVATDCRSGPRELLREDAGILVPVDDPAAMATAVRTILTDRATAEVFSEASRRRASDFEAGAIVRRWADELDAIRRRR